MVSDIMSMSREELLSCISDRKSEIIERLKKGETEESFSIAAASYTNSEWEKLLGKVDKNIEAVKEQQKEKREEERKEFYETGSTKYNYFIAKLNGTYKETVPYGYLAQDGVINYNGVTFVCDEQKNAICLGDMSDKRNVLTIPLSDGGCLMVNRSNLGDLSKAMSMFSPEDINLILRAIADDKKAQEMQETIEEETNSIGEDAENNVLEQEQLEQLVY